jgi:exodeoxyribonuclease VII large subunit
MALNELKEKLQKKGYFAVERKKPLPLLPKGIGVVSSPVGAAIKDIGKVMKRRYPGMPIILFPTLVQGEKAVDTVVEGIRHLNEREDIDVIIVARGGGSSEDLNVFNSEKVADAVFNSSYPIVSAIGHEIDFTITDMVADVRAATPSMAGELVVPVKDDLIKMLEKQNERLHNIINARIDRERMRLTYLSETGFLKRPERWLNQYRDEISKKEEQISSSLNKLLIYHSNTLSIIAGKLHSLSPLATMARGYSICTDQKGEVLTSSENINLREIVNVRLYTGSIRCEVLEKGVDSREQSK